MYAEAVSLSSRIIKRLYIINDAVVRKQISKVIQPTFLFRPEVMYEYNKFYHHFVLFCGLVG